MTTKRGEDASPRESFGMISHKPLFAIEHDVTGES